VCLFDLVEDALGLERHIAKICVMDDERSTSTNLRTWIFAARERMMFINTGFLDRTGDEIHTAIEAGPRVSPATPRPAGARGPHRIRCARCWRRRSAT